MILTYYGLTCFKVQSGNDVLAIDPFGKGAEFSAPRFEAHIVTLSDPRHTQDFSITGTPLVLGTPGEYEVRGISIIGFNTEESTSFLIEWEGLRLLHCGTTTKKTALSSLMENIETVDILCISAGGNPTEIQKIIADIDPRIIIPMHAPGAKKSSVDALVKEIGEKPEHLDKFTIKKKGLPIDGQRLIILEASGT